MITAQTILDCKKRKVHIFEVPDWDINVAVLSLTLKERTELIDWLQEKSKSREGMSGFELVKANLEDITEVCVKVLCNEEGELIFTEKDIPALSNQGGDALQFIVEEAIGTNFLQSQKKT